MTRVAIYARYSSDRQSESSIEAQVERCRRHATERGWTVAAVHADYAVSGASLDRPGWLACMRSVERREVEAVLVEDLSRVSRDAADAHTVTRALRHHDVALVGVADGVDTSARGSKLLVGVRALLADAYLDDLRDKTLRGLEARARAGLSTGGLPYGYRSSPRPEGGRVIEIDPDQAAIVRRVFAQYAAGRSRGDIAAALNAEGVPPPRSSRRARAPSWQHTTLRAILANRRYLGEWTFGAREWRKLPGTNVRRPRARVGALVRLERPELAIVDHALFAAAQSASSAEPRPATMTADERRGSARRSYLLSGLARCGVCGGLLTVHGGTEGRRYYRCADARARGTCASRSSVREEDLRALVLRLVRDHLFAPERLVALRAVLAERIAARGRGASRERDELEARIARAQAQAERLVDAVAGGAAPSALVARLRELESEIATHRAALAALPQAPRALPSVAELEARVRQLETLLASADVTTARDALRGVVSEVRVTPQGGVAEVRAGLLPAALVGVSGGRGRVGIAGARTADLVTLEAVGEVQLASRAS
jgi:DNA invertase Pin-like site-specific DNA recombinase